MLNQGHILTAEEMRNAENALVADGTSVIDLMDTAGKGAAHYIWRISNDSPTLVLCGPGNNGGDGYVIAQWLLQKGVDVKVAEFNEPGTEAARDARSRWDGPTLSATEADPMRQFVDCLFGTGLSRGVDGDFLKHYLRLAKGASRRVAIDVPSGVNSDTGAFLNEIPSFDLTIALGAHKPAHFLEPARSAMGSVAGVALGIKHPSRTKMLEKPSLSQPASGDHKYTRGLVAVVAGAMHGAAELTAMAAQKSGAGYVKILNNNGLKSPKSSIVVQDFESVDDLKILLSDERISAIVIGPGLGRNVKAAKILDCALRTEKPIVLDADALSILGKDFSKNLKNHMGPVVATPHLGEFEAIGAEPADSKLDQVRVIAKKSDATILLKGSDTVIANPDERLFMTGNACNWLSTAGTGDILAGIIAARMAVGGDPFHSAAQGQWLHARAARLAGPAFAPEMLIDQIPAAIAECL